MRTSSTEHKNNDNFYCVTERNNGRIYFIQLCGNVMEYNVCNVMECKYNNVIENNGI